MSKAEVDPRGWPDYTYPMTIIGQELNVAIDIAAQSLPTLDVNIAASAVTLNVNIAESAVTLNVNIESISEGVTFNVAQSGTWTINAVQTGTWTINIGAPLDAEGNVETSIVKSVQLDVNIAASAVTLNINIESISEGVVFNVAQSGSWTINAVQSGTWTINIGAPLDASGYLQTHIMDSVQLDVNIAASAVTLNVAIQSSDVTLNVNIESIGEGVVFNVAQSGTWTINAVQSGSWSINIGSVTEGVTFDVNITGSTVTLDVNIASSAVTLNVNITGSDVTLNVNIASSSVAINIKTETGANIVIDRLTATAYTEERRVIANNGPSATMLAPGTSIRRGKYFPRGCRGFINEIEVYCDNPDTSLRKLYIYVSPQPGMAPIITATLSVMAGGSPAWRPVTIKRYWNYDSLFVWVLGETSSYPRVGYDTGEPYDSYYSTDGITWAPENQRWWIRLDMAGQTVGDLPVSGTLNTIEVPSASSVIESETIPINPGETKTLISVEGSGKVEGLMFKMWIHAGNPHPGNCKLHFVIDGVDYALIFSHLADIFEYRTDTVSPFSLTVYDDAAGDWGFALNKPIEFKSSFQLKVESTAAPDNIFYVKAYALITLIN